jgi:hypothetical protein
MASPSKHDQESTSSPPVLKRRRWVYRVALGLLIILLALGVYGWTSREQLARDLIGEQFDELGLPATSQVEDISTDKQVLTGIVIGDPANPDLTIEQVDVELAYGFGVPEIGRITLIKPKLYGSYLDGKLSFGSLDPVIFAESDEPAGLPALDLKLVDGRGLIESDFGAIGLKVEGEGQLDNGFEGIIAAIAPKLAYGNCLADRVSSYGKISTDSGAITLAGPTRFGVLRCQAAGLALKDAGLEATTLINSTLSGVSLDGSLATGAVGVSGVGSQGISGPIRLSINDGKLDSTFDLTADRLVSNQFAAATLELDGTLRARDGFENATLDVDVDGQGIDLGQSASVQLAELSQSTDGTLFQPL